jgi:hypothetical protein
LAHHLGRDIGTIEVADPDATIVRALAVELTAKVAVLDQFDHRASCRVAPRLVTLGRREAVQAYWQAPDLDCVAIADMRDLASESLAGAG